MVVSSLEKLKGEVDGNFLFFFLAVNFYIAHKHTVMRYEEPSDTDGHRMSINSQGSLRRQTDETYKYRNRCE